MTLPTVSSCGPLSSTSASSLGGTVSGLKPVRTSSQQLKTKAKAVVLRCWRHRMSPIQFSIELKKMLADEANRGPAKNSSTSLIGKNATTTKTVVSPKAALSQTYVGDSCDLAEILIRQGFGGQAPNRLILSYVEFCLGGGVISFKETLRQATTPTAAGSDPTKSLAADVSRPECLKALLRLVDTFVHWLLDADVAGDTVNDCLENARVLAKTVEWIVGVLERVTATAGKTLDASLREVVDACRLALKRIVDEEPVLAALAKIGVWECGADMAAKISKKVEAVLGSTLAAASTSSDAEKAVIPKHFQELLTRLSSLASTPMTGNPTMSKTKKERDDDDGVGARRDVAAKSGSAVEETQPDVSSSLSGGPLDDKTLTLPISVFTFVEVVLSPFSACPSGTSSTMGVDRVGAHAPRSGAIVAQILALEKVLRASRSRVVAQLVRAAFLGVVDAKDNEGSIADKCLGDGHRGSGEELKWFGEWILFISMLTHECTCLTLTHLFRIIFQPFSC